MSKPKPDLKGLHMPAWQRLLLTGLSVALTGEVYLTVWAEGFRVSFAAILYPILLVVVMRERHSPDTGLVTGIFVLTLRLFLDVLAETPLSYALRLEYPGGVFYFIYDAILCILLPDRRSATPGTLWGIFAVCDFLSNSLNLLLSQWTHLDGFMFLTLAGLALLRSLAAAGTLWLMISYHQLLTQQEHERRYQRLFLMTAELKCELYFLQKSAEETERIMSSAYHLYERMEQLNAPEEDQSLALSIARDVHEVKKDSLRVLRGLESEVAQVYDRDSVPLSDLLLIVENSTRHMLGQSRSNIRLEVRCLTDFPVRSHYQLIAAVKNLVTNAVEAIQSDSGQGTVCVLARKEGDHLCLEISDNGPGLTDRAREKLFQVGYSTKFDPETGNIGRGVGLVSVQHIVEELNGTIQVESEPGKGARFLLNIPLNRLEGDLT